PILWLIWQLLSVTERRTFIRRCLIRRKVRSHFLMAAIFAEGLFVVEAQRLEHRRILDREEHGILAWRGVSMLMQRPRRQSDDVSFAPDEALPVDNRRAFPSNDVVDGAAGMAVRLRTFARAQHLRPTGHRRHNRAACLRMAVFEGDAVKGASLMFAQRAEGLPGAIPRAEQQRRRLRFLLHPSRA